MTISKTLIPKASQKEVTVELLFIGDELLTGTIVDTNAQWISSKITGAGGIVKRITTVRDRTIDITCTQRVY